MPRQTEIKIPPPQVKIATLHETVIGVVRKFGPRKDYVLAQQLGATPQHFSDVAGGKTGKHWPEAWIEKIVRQYDFEAEIPSLVAGWRGLEVRPPRGRPPAEELRRLKFALAQHNGLGKAIRDEADSLPDDFFADEESP